MHLLAQGLPLLTSHISSTIVYCLLIMTLVFFLAMLVTDIATESNTKIMVIVGIITFVFVILITIGISALIYHAEWIDYNRMLHK